MRLVTAILGLLMLPLAGLGDATHSRFEAHWEVYEVTINDPGQSTPHVSFWVTWRGPAAASFAGYQGETELGSGMAWFVPTSAHAGATSGTNSEHVVLIRSSETDAVTGTLLPGQGTFRVVAIWAGDIELHDVWTSVPGNVTLIASGEAHAYSGHELDQGALADASAGVVHARGSLTRSLRFHVEHHLAGWFLDSSLFGTAQVGSAILRSETTYDECVQDLQRLLLPAPAATWSVCRWEYPTGPRSRPAGNYEFEWTGAQATVGEGMLVVWADVPWPIVG